VKEADLSFEISVFAEVHLALEPLTLSEEDVSILKSFLSNFGLLSDHL